MHRWFDCFPWLDLSRLVLIHFPLISFFSSFGCSFVLLTLFFVHIDFLYVFDIFHTSFLYILSSVQYSSFFLFHHGYIHRILSSSSIYSYWTSLDPWFMRLSACITFYTRGYRVLIIGYLSQFPFISLSYYPSLRYVLSLKTTLRPWHHLLCLIALTWAIFEIGQRAFWKWWTKICGMTLHWGIVTSKSFIGYAVIMLDTLHWGAHLS